MLFGQVIWMLHPASETVGLLVGAKASRMRHILAELGFIWIFLSFLGDRIFIENGIQGSRGFRSQGLFLSHGDGVASRSTSRPSSRVATNATCPLSFSAAKEPG